MSLRAALASKRARTGSFHFPVDEAGASALADWAAAERDVTLAVALGKDPGPARARQDALADTIREHCQVIRFRGLTEDERDALISAHTILEDDKELLAKNPDATRIDRLPFVAHALAATVLDEDNLSAGEWEKELASERWTAGDLSALFERIVKTTGEQPAASIPFD